VDVALDGSNIAVIRELAQSSEQWQRPMTTLMNTFIRQTAERRTEQNIYREVKYIKIHDTINTIADYRLT